MSDLVVRPSGAIEPTTMPELVQFATAAAKSRLFGVDSPEAALMIAMAGRDLGFSYAQSLRAFHVVKGKPTLSADGMVAAALASGQCDFFRAVEITETSATWETQRKGSQAVRYTFTMQDAERAGLVNDMYRRHPRRMLSARAKAYLARDVYPDLMLGLLTEDEAYEAAAKAPRVVVEQVAVSVTAPPPAEDTHQGTNARNWLFELEGCTSEADLTALWKATARERDAMTEQDRNALRDMFSARKAEIGGEAR